MSIEIGARISVLDHGFVRLVDFMGSDLSIVRNARVSHDAPWRAEEGEAEGSDAKLINYLWRNRHTSPFEACEISFEVQAPIFIFRQWHRHRTWSYNELSARYAEMPELFYVPHPAHIGTQSDADHQARDMPEDDGTFYMDDYIQGKLMHDHNTAAFVLYRELLEAKMPRELARSVLPVATYSRMFAKTDLMNLFRFLELRLSEHAQYEIRVYAEAMFQMAKQLFPIACGAFQKYSLDKTKKG